MPPMNRRKTLPPPLHIDHIARDPHDSSATEDSDDSPPPFNPPLSSMSRRKNTKKLSLTLPSAASSSYSLANPSEPHSAVDGTHPDLPRTATVAAAAAVGSFTTRRSSVVSLPTTAGPTSSLLHRKEEEGGSPTIPYAEGPVEVIPGIWLGSEDNARDWKTLLERGIRSILNVAKEVTSPFDSLAAQPLRSTASVPNLRLGAKPTGAESTYYPPHVPSGRPGMNYLKLQWSHGQKDLVNDGFQAGIAFTDAALARGDGVLVHCQCGISRSATMVIALVMRAAAERSASVPPEVWDLKGMQGAYTFVKEKSKWVGPNMSLIYELLDYEKKLRTDSGSPGFSDAGSDATSEEEEWTRKRQLLDDTPSSDVDNVDQESSLVMQEARALDKAMEDRIVARKSSASSLASTGSGGIGMGAAWRSRYHPRKRAGSIASNVTNNSIISENLVEEEEESELLGVGGGFDDDRQRRRSADTLESSVTNSPDDDDEVEATPRNVVYAPDPFISLPRAPPSAPAWKKSFDLPPPPPPLTAVRSTFQFPPKLAKPKAKRRPPPIGLPPVPSSPVTVVVNDQDSNPTSTQPTPGPAAAPAPFPLVSTSPPNLPSPSQSLPNTTKVPPRLPSSLSLPRHPASVPKPGLPQRQRIESRRPAPPPLHLLRKSSAPESSLFSPLATSHQTLFVFPPSPTLTTRTPSAVMLTTTNAVSSNTVRGGTNSNMIPFPTISTPKISTFRKHGRTRSFIGIGTPMTPTTAFTKVEARGYVGLE